VAIESYRVDTNAYPAAIRAVTSATTDYLADTNNNTIGDATNPGMNVNYALASPQIAAAGLRARPTFCISSGLASITTPTAYISSYPIDPFADTKGAVFQYVNMANKVWFLASYGPDLDENPVLGGTVGSKGNGGGQMCQGRTAAAALTHLVRFCLPGGASKTDMSWDGYNEHYSSNGYGPQWYGIYGPSNSRPTDRLLTGGYTYDTTNGTKSAGDIYRLKQ